MAERNHARRQGDGDDNEAEHEKRRKKRAWVGGKGEVEKPKVVYNGTGVGRERAVKKINK